MTVVVKRLRHFSYICKRNTLHETYNTYVGNVIKKKISLILLQKSQRHTLSFLYKFQMGLEFKMTSTTTGTKSNGKLHLRFFGKTASTLFTNTQNTSPLKPYKKEN